MLFPQVVIFGGLDFAMRSKKFYKNFIPFKNTFKIFRNKLKRYEHFLTSASLLFLLKVKCGGDFEGNLLDFSVVSKGFLRMFSKCNSIHLLSSILDYCWCLKK